MVVNVQTVVEGLPQSNLTQDLIERSNKMQPRSRIYYSNVPHLLNVFRATLRPSSEAQKLIAASGFTYVFGCWTSNQKRM
jgi:hypothetical protein